MCKVDNHLVQSSPAQPSRTPQRAQGTTKMARRRRIPQYAQPKRQTRTSAHRMALSITPKTPRPPFFFLLLKQRHPRRLRSVPSGGPKRAGHSRTNRAEEAPSVIKTIRAPPKARRPAHASSSDKPIKRGLPEAKTDSHARDTTIPRTTHPRSKRRLEPQPLTSTMTRPPNDSKKLHVALRKSAWRPPPHGPRRRPGQRPLIFPRD